MTALVVAEDDMTRRQPGRREQELARDVRERVTLVGRDVDEL